jgi:hypothetical protein
MTIRVQGETIFDAEDTSANHVSEKILVAQTKQIIIQAEVVGTPDGFLDVEVSSEMTEKSGNVMIWSRVHREVVQSAEDYLFFLNDAGYKWIRFSWVDNGTSVGTVSARYTFKGDW